VTEGEAAAAVVRLTHCHRRQPRPREERIALTVKKRRGTRIESIEVK
jgi:hypothetical protein